MINNNRSTLPMLNVAQGRRESILRKRDSFNVTYRDEYVTSFTSRLIFRTKTIRERCHGEYNVYTKCGQFLCILSVGNIFSVAHIRALWLQGCIDFKDDILKWKGHRAVWINIPRLTRLKFTFSVQCASVYSPEFFNRAIFPVTRSKCTISKIILEEVKKGERNFFFNYTIPVDMHNVFGCITQRIAAGRYLCLRADTGWIIRAIKLRGIV